MGRFPKFKKKFKIISKKVKSIIDKKGFKFFLPSVYILGLLISLILALAYIPFRSLVICSSLFGQQFCTPAGIYFASIISLPGYFIAGNLLNIPAQLKWYFSLIFVLLSTVSFYYLVGLFIDKYRDSSTSKVTLIIIAVFVVLLFLLITLARQSAMVP